MDDPIKSIEENLFNLLIRKRKVLIPGKGDVQDYSNGTKVSIFSIVNFMIVIIEKKQFQVTFHFKTEASYSDDDESDMVMIDDSKSSNKPMELFIGKQFKFPLWEEWIKHMRLGEVSQLSLDWTLCRDVYPLLSKSYRNFANPQDHNHDDPAKRSHCCGKSWLLLIVIT